MSRSKPSLYVNVFEVRTEDLAQLNERDLATLVERLLHAQASHCGSPLDQLRVNAEDKASDDGCDAWTAAPQTADPWLGTTDTCWQFKAGTAGSPSKLKGEVKKTIPLRTLRRGGRFVVVTNGSTSGLKGEEKRREQVRSEAPKYATRIDVIGIERLRTWCNQHPAIAAQVTGLPANLRSLTDWVAVEDHQLAWQATPKIEAELKTLRARLDPATGLLRHLHIFGPPGVGKTRLALELCRGAAWHNDVVYFGQADERVSELIDQLSAQAGTRIVLVVDNVPSEQVESLSTALRHQSHHGRLITIGYQPNPDPEHIEDLELVQSDSDTLEVMVHKWYPQLSREKVAFVVQFADGYVRLARLAAKAVAQNPRLSVGDLLGRQEITSYLTHLLGKADHQALYVPALMKRVGWSGGVVEEGRAIARHLGLTWTDVCYRVDEFHKRLQIAPRAGRYRLLSPTPLALYLAAEAWDAIPDQIASLPEVLPSDQARIAFFDQIRKMASFGPTRRFAEQALVRAIQHHDLINPHAAERWAALSAANPELAAQQLLAALERLSQEDRFAIAHQARRALVSTLVKLAWKPTVFHTALRALSLLAQAENETWASNATGAFIQKYQIRLGGTALSYPDRLLTISTIIATKQPQSLTLAIRALAMVGRPDAFRWNTPPPSDQAPDDEWHPHDSEEHRRCVILGIDRLTEIADLAIESTIQPLLEAAQSLLGLYPTPAFRQALTRLFSAIHAAFPDSREPLRRLVARYIHTETSFGNRLSPKILQDLQALHAQFEGLTFDDQLHQCLGTPFWERSTLVNLEPYARRLVQDAKAFFSNWRWLTSGEAYDAGRLGETMAEIDNHSRLQRYFTKQSLSEPDLQIVYGYYCAKRAKLGDRWYNRWLKRQFKRGAWPARFYFELTRRCSLTEEHIDLLVELLESQAVTPDVISAFGYGRWWETLSAGSLSRIVRALVAGSHAATALIVLAQRLRACPTELELWASEAYPFLKSPDWVRQDGTIEHSWKDLAQRYVDTYPVEITIAILEAHAIKTAEGWFIEYAEVASVLQACCRKDPQGVWALLSNYLSGPGATTFCIGFPSWVLQSLPTDEILAWLAVDVDTRAEVLASITPKTFQDDDSLEAQILGSYADRDRVAKAFVAQLSHSWTGKASDHWQTLASKLAPVAERTGYPLLRLWINQTVEYLTQQAKRDREWEAERWFGV